MAVARRILIVDDEPNVRLVFRTTLESTGVELAAAEDGASALEWLRANRVDLVLLDLRMPTMGGLELLAKLRSEDINVPVIFITAHGSIPDAVAAIKLGAIDFLSKPITPEALRRAVADVLGRDLPKAELAGKPTGEGAGAGDRAEFQGVLRDAKRSINRREFADAEGLLRKAIDLDRKSAEAHNLMGVLHESRGDLPASYRAYRDALKADRDYEPARLNMQRYYERTTFGRSDLPVAPGDF